ncbi:MAG: hypothetical protein AAF676_17270 [Pseudomonadota bacterium]
MKTVIPAMTLAAAALAALVAMAPKEFEMASAKAPHFDIASPAYALSLPLMR